MGRKKSIQNSIEVERSHNSDTQLVRCDLRIGSPETFGYFGVKGIDTAPALVRLARVKGLSLIAIADFYDASFAERVVAASENADVVVLLGTSIRASLPGCDEVILTILFPETSDSGDVYTLLELLEVPVSARGNEKFLCSQPLGTILNHIESSGAVVFPSRMDQTPAKRVALDMLVDKFGFRAFDLAHEESVHFFSEQWPNVDFSLMHFSNARALAQVGSRYTSFAIEEPSFEALAPLLVRANVVKKRQQKGNNPRASAPKLMRTTALGALTEDSAPEPETLN